MKPVKKWEDRLKETCADIFRRHDVQPSSKEMIYLATSARQEEIDELRAALAASGGNAAPPDACPIAITDSSAPNGIKWYVEPPDHLKNGMNLYFVPAKIVPASSPNAALVAALQAVLRVGRGSSGRLILEKNDEDAVHAALSAAGVKGD